MRCFQEPQRLNDVIEQHRPATLNSRNTSQMGPADSTLLSETIKLAGIPEKPSSPIREICHIASAKGGTLAEPLRIV